MGKELGGLSWGGMPIPGRGTEPIPGCWGILWGGMLPPVGGMLDEGGMLPPVGIIPGYPPLNPVMGGIPKLGGGP